MHSHSPDLRHPDISSCDAIFVLETEMRKCNFFFHMQYCQRCFGKEADRIHCTLGDGISAKSDVCVFRKRHVEMNGVEALRRLSGTRS